MPYGYSDKLETVDGVPTLTRTYHDGSSQTMTGYEALANDGSSRAAAGWRRLNPSKTQQHRRTDRPGDKGMWESVGEYASKGGHLVNKSFAGKILDAGMLPGAAFGGATGLLGGLAANWFAKSVLGANNPHFGLVGGLGGALLGGLIGHERNVKEASFQKDLEKAATMYRDPRNFVLEKLRMASDIGTMEKAQLAARVRNMDPVQASRLADAVRASLGFGVGALVAKFLGRSAMSGGFAGLLGMALLGTVAKKNGLF